MEPRGGNRKSEQPTLSTVVCERQVEALPCPRAFLMDAYRGSQIAADKAMLSKVLVM